MTEFYRKLFYPSAIIKDVELLKHDEYGVYIRLLEHMWISGGKLPHDDTKIAHYLRITPKKWQNYKKILQNFFIFSDKTFTHTELKKEYQKTILISQKNSLKARKRWSKQNCNIPEDIISIGSKNCKSNDAIAYAIAMPQHMQKQCYVRASKKKDIDLRLDDIDRHVDNSGQLVVYHELYNKLQLLFSEHNMRFPKDQFLLVKWIKTGISIDSIYQKIVLILQRISKQGLEHPKSFAYFTAEIQRCC
ncbi:DUF1376 domain-containing protein [Candidatus Tisiphia endosymbiont of Ptychoptera albimana]|jgi:uncharacterized protein YdaU (DUF1376 family)|uniref:DUF1376 domain-containing protein n=1 Tax=Candidatus Tisiphia endosymbiont of Ptychoptera albimana TaxID=3066260 RepID=UPI00312CA0AA